MGTTTGKRISRSHTTAITLASELALFLDEHGKDGSITKVVLGVITARCGAKTPKVIIARDQFNLRVTVIEVPAKQELYVSAPDRDKAIEVIAKWCKTREIGYTIR